MKNNNFILQVENLKVTFAKDLQALRGIDLSVREGSIHGLVGESGSGKSVTSMTVMGLLQTPPASIEEGKILFKGQDLLSLSPEEMRKKRGKELSIVFQEPSKYLNPALKIGEQIGETLRLHLNMTREQSETRTLELLNLVGLKGGKRILNTYPHELSGGMKQRAMIAMAISCNPSFLIADEPTTALDVTLQLQILKLIKDLKNRLNMTILFISHDLAVVKEIADFVSVIYAGKIVENANIETIFNNPLHPYTQLLLLSIPDASKRGKKLKSIPGKVPSANAIPTGCAFHPRCPIAKDICRETIPPLKEVGGNHTVACHFPGRL